MPPTRRHDCRSSPTVALRLETAPVASVVSPVTPFATFPTSNHLHGPPFSTLGSSLQTPTFGGHQSVVRSPPAPGQFPRRPCACDLKPRRSVRMVVQPRPCDVQGDGIGQQIIRLPRICGVAANRLQMLPEPHPKAKLVASTPVGQSPAATKNPAADLDRPVEIDNANDGACRDTRRDLDDP